MNSQMTIAAHILAMLAYTGSQQDSAVTSEQLAESVGTNPVVIRRVLARLSYAGLVESRRGVGGGSVLARKPQEISLGDVYKAVTKEEQCLIGRHEDSNTNCTIAPVIRDYLCELYTDAEQALLDRLSAVTVEDMFQELTSRGGANNCPKGAKHG